MYMVTSGTHYGGRCCFDYGNAEHLAKSFGPGTMEAIYFGNHINWNRLQETVRNKTGPWVMADLEAGMYAAMTTLTTTHSRR